MICRLGRNVALFIVRHIWAYIETAYLLYIFSPAVVQIIVKKTNHESRAFIVVHTTENGV